MRPRSASSSSKWRTRFPLPLFILTFLTLIVFRIVQPILSPSHDDSLQITLHSTNFLYKVTTYYNIDAKRCAFIQCGPEIAHRHIHATTCDIVFVGILKSKTNVSLSHCIIDYVHSQWESLSRRYNHGFMYVSDNAVLRIPTRELPLDANAIHLSVAQNNIDLSTSWLSVWPSNTTRAVFRAWYEELLKTPLKLPNREHVSLNRIRNCRSEDIECHPYTSSIAWQCDGTYNPKACLSPSLFQFTWQTFIISISVVTCIMAVATTLSSTIPRVRAIFRLSRDASLKSIPLTPVLILLLLVAMAGEDWVTIVRLVARTVGVNFSHALESQPFSNDADVYRAVAGLRGVHDGYAYIFRDGSSLVRVSGPGVVLVVNIIAILFFFKRLFYGGFFVRCVVATLVVRGGCDIIIAVVGQSKHFSGDDDDDEGNEYIRRRSELSAVNMGRSRGRTFVLSRENSSSTPSVGAGKGQ